MKTRIFSLTLAVVLLIVFGVGSALAAPKFKLVYYDGHMHTTRSDGHGSVADIKAMALSRGLSAVIITDHCWMLTREEWASLVAECQAASDATFLALPGFEVTGNDGIFNRTHVNALNVADPFVGNDSDCLCPEEVWPSPFNPAGTGAMYPENITKWVDYIHSQGGIAVHNHTSGTTELMYGVDNIEVYNQSHVDDVMGYASQLGYPPSLAWQFAIMENNFAIYGERDANKPVPWFGGTIPFRYALYYGTQYFPPYVGQWLGAPQAPLTSWDQLLMAYVNGVVDEPVFGLANSDAHNTDDLNCTDGSCSKVGVAKNGAYVKALTATELYKAIKSGKTFATTGPSLNLDVNGELMGDTAYIADGGTANIKLSVNSECSAPLVRIDIIKNGVIWKIITPNLPTYVGTLKDVVTEDGYYRVEVTSLGSSGYQFAWSNPVFVRVP
jgi:hypothetical protein